MLKKILPILMVCLAIAAQAKPKLPPIKSNAIKINLLSPIYSNLSLSYQYCITPFRSLQINAAYMNFNDNINYSNNQLTTEGFSITPEYRMNFSGYGLNGFYAGPFLRYLDYHKTFQESWYSSSAGFVKTTEKSHFQSIGLGFNFGHQFIIKNKIVIDLFAGPVYQVLIKNQVENSIPPNIGPNYSRSPEFLAASIPNKYIKGYGISACFTIGLAF